MAKSPESGPSLDVQGCVDILAVSAHSAPRTAPAPTAASASMKQHVDVLGDQPAPYEKFVCPLPGDQDIWSRSPLGDPAQWPASLAAYTRTIAAFSHPTALFVGEDWALLQNQAWWDAGEPGQQGQSQRGRVSDDVRSLLTGSSVGARVERIAGHEFLQKDDDTAHTAVVTTLLAAAESEVATNIAIVQLIAAAPTSEGDAAVGSAADHVSPATDDDAADMSTLERATKNVPLDEHPFFHAFAEMIPTGIAILDHQAHAVFVNHLFYTLTTHEGDDKTFLGWPQSIHPDDYDRVMDAYREAFRDQTPLRTEFRANGQKNPWRLLLLTPVREEHLPHISLHETGGFVCSVVDVTNQKQNQLDERKKAKEATERKEQQERFIDMISHEIRNPLSAILHANEDIQEAIRDAGDGHGEVDVELVQEAVSTIAICLEHQRNIVDDVLSFSKLDASMLSLKPVVCNPSRQLADNLKMFQPEFRRQTIGFDFANDNSYVDCRVEWVFADMARIGQILVNLTSNAIKFTARKEGEKHISVSVGAGMSRPDSYPPNVVFFSSTDSEYRRDATNKAEWGDGESLYIMVAVKDTGIGISEEGQERLFERFSQATPKTAEVYGGSGLGLNISRKICHLHGGEIGVSSKEGEGSTFGFFFKVKRSRIEQREKDLTHHDDTTEALKDQMRDLDLEEPDKLTKEMIPQSLETPPTMDVMEVNPDIADPHDKRLSVTRRAASNTSQQSEEAEKSTPGATSGKSEAGNSKPASEAGRHEAGKSKATSESGQNPSTAHILLVEDNVINQKILHRKLERKGFTVTPANNGKEAVEIVKFKSHEITLILMDQEMPVMDGQTATREIRRLEKDGAIDRIPICGVTANVRAEQQDGMIASGMDDVISKPYSIEQMVEKIRMMLGG